MTRSCSTRAANNWTWGGLERHFHYTYDDGRTWDPLFDPSAGDEAQTEAWAKLRRVLPEAVASPMPVGPDISFQLGRHQLAWSEDEPGRVVGVDDGIVCRSDDYGKTWEPAMAGLIATEIERVTLDPDDPKAAFCADSMRLWRTADGGATWRAMPFHIRGINQVVFSPGGRHVFAVCLHEVWRGTRTGTDWEKVWEPDNRRLMTVGVFFYEDGDAEELESVAVLVTRGSLFESRDDGRTWQSAGTNALPKAAAVDPLHSTQVRIPGQDTDTWIVDHKTSKWHRLASTDHGRTWAPYEPTKDIGMGRWSVAADGSMWVAVDALLHVPAPGTSGVVRRLGQVPKPTAVVCDPNGADVLYVGCWDGRIFRTTDGAETFSELDGGPPAIPIGRLVISPLDGSLWVATEGNGVWILDNPKTQPGTPLSE